MSCKIMPGDIHTWIWDKESTAHTTTPHLIGLEDVSEKRGDSGIAMDVVDTHQHEEGGGIKVDFCRPGNLRDRGKRDSQLPQVTRAVTEYSFTKTQITSWLEGCRTWME